MGCYVDYSKKYVYLQYKKTPAAQHYTVQRASYLFHGEEWDMVQV